MENRKKIVKMIRKAYFEDKKYTQGEGYAVEALISEPENLWYLETLVDILEKQGKAIDVVSTRIPFENLKLKESDRLAEILELYKQFHIPFDLEESVLSVHGAIRQKNASPHKLCLPQDHRVVAAGELFLKLNGGGDLSPCDAINKSWRYFSWDK